jgi:hypothetical protein
VPNPADLLKQLFIDASGTAGWARRVLCAALPGLVSGTVWTARLQGSPPMAAQAGAGPLPAGERRGSPRRTAAWLRARGRRVVVFCRQNRQLARRQSGFKCSPRLTGRMLGEEVDRVVRICISDACYRR